MKYLFLILFLGVLLINATPVSATVINSYDFNGNLVDSLGHGANLTAFGGNLAPFGRYSFNLNQGLSLANAFASTTSYSIEIKFQVNAPTTSSWHKLVDYQNLVEDTGFYFHSTASTGPFGVQFYPDVFDGPGGIPLNTDAVLRLTRNGVSNEVEGFLNNVSQWKFVDISNNAVPRSNLLTFFIDDTLTSQRESFVGSVDYIRISDNPVAIPEPSSFAIWSLCGLTLIRIRSRRVI